VLGTFELFCCICVFIPTTVLNGQVLFAIFAIGIMFPCRFHKAREEYSGRNRCPNFIFFAAEASLVLCMLKSRNDKRLRDFDYLIL
jgi:hypothetical protein